MFAELAAFVLDDIWPAIAALAVLALTLAPLAYFVLTVLDLREGIVARRARNPCALKLVKAVCHGLLFLKVLLM